MSKSRFQSVWERLERACDRAGRKPDEVKLVAVTKGHSVEEIEQAVLRHGHRVLGENRVQEWQDKNEALENVEWHFVGNLQRNKVKYLEDITLIHSLNSQRLADELQKRGKKMEKVFRALVEVNVAGEDSKQGVGLKSAEDLVHYARDLSHVRVDGVMTIAPYVDNPETVRKVFRTLCELRDKLSLSELSMGMSGDFEVAVEEGATLIRVGSALFADND